MTTADHDDEHEREARPPDDVPQSGEAQVDGRAFFEPIGLRARGPLALAAGQVHQVDVGLLGDVLPGEDLTSDGAERQEVERATPAAEVTFEKVQQW